VRRVERSLDPRNPGRSARSLRGLRSLARSSREPEVAVKNFPVDVWWPVYEARTAHFAVFGVSGVVHQRVYRGLGHGGMSPQRCRDARARVSARGGGGRGAGSGERGSVAWSCGGARGKALRAVSAEGVPRWCAEGAKWQWWWQWVADGEGICWREWLASRITTGRVIRGGCSRWGGRVRLGWGMDDGEASGAVRCGAVRCGAVRCGAVRRGAVRCGAVWCGSARERHTQWHSTKNVARERPPLENLHASRGRS